MENLGMSVSPEEWALLQVLYNVVIPGGNQELTRSRKIHEVLAKHLKKNLSGGQNKQIIK